MNDLKQIEKDCAERENKIIKIASSKRLKHVLVLTYTELQTEKFGLLKEYCILDYEDNQIRGSSSLGFDLNEEQALDELNKEVAQWNFLNVDLSKIEVNA